MLKYDGKVMEVSTYGENVYYIVIEHTSSYNSDHARVLDTIKLMPSAHQENKG